MHAVRIARAEIVALTLVLVFALAVPVAAASPTTPTGRPLRDCASILAPDPTAQSTVIEGVFIQTARRVDSRCFGTFAEALAYGSGGALHVPANLQPQDMTAAMASPASSASTPYLLGVNYSDIDFNSNSGSWSHFASSGCTPTSGWQIAQLQNGIWTEGNNIASSKGFSGCDRTRHWENPSFQGVTILCLPWCYTLGVLNNQTDSIRWFG